MTDTETAELATKRLLGTMKKYTHTIVLRRADVKPIVIEDDRTLESHCVIGVDGNVLTIGYSNPGLFMVRMADVLYHHTVENPTND